MRYFSFLAALVVILATPAYAAAPCFKLDGQTYCRVWSAKDASVAKNEYLRAGETTSHWQRMVTVIRYDGVASLKQAVSRYMAVVAPYLGPDANPQWIKPSHGAHAEAAATRLLLSTPDMSDSEYVVAYFFHDTGKPAYAVIFSQHLPLPGGQTPTMAQYGGWLHDMQAIKPEPM